MYPIAARQTRGLVHLKTAGTSYLEALRAVATVEPDLMREILAFARERYEEDKASYHVSADVLGVPPPEGSCFLFLDVRTHLHERKLLGFLEDCLEDGVVLSPGSSSGEDYPDWVRLCFTAAPPDRTIQAAHLLAKRLGRG